MATKNWCQEWQEREDYHDWKSCLEKAIARKDYPRVKELVEEGINCEYEFPLISDAEALKIIANTENQ
mgnify:CR=1 FL=1